MIERITVCGLGKLGACIAATFAAAGVRVCGYDLDTAKVDLVSRGLAPVEEPGLQETIDAVKEGCLRASVNLTEALHESQACLFIVPTPSLPDGSFDHAYLTNAVAAVVREIEQQKTQDFLFIINSTVVPGTCQQDIQPLLEKYCPKPWHLIYKPELIALGTVMHDLKHPDVVLIGADKPSSRYLATELYQRILPKQPNPSDPNAPSIKWLGLTAAEIAKISLNCAITMKISFANQVAMLAERMGCAPQLILEAVGADRRIGPRSLVPGLPYAGPCFPRDARMFQYIAAIMGVQVPLAAATDRINELVLRNILARIPDTGSIGILGMAYKPGAIISPEIESTGRWLCERLHHRDVSVHDPKLKGLSVHDVLACDTVIVACPHPEYAQLEVPLGTLLIDPMHVIKPRTP